MSLPHGVIIAGGKGERLGGVRKAELRIGGRRLIDRVADGLGEMESLIVSVGPVDDGRRSLAGATVITDLDSPVGGPLAGLAAAVASLQARGVSDGFLVSVAVDTPFLPHDFVSRLEAALGDAPAAYSAWGEQFYPPNAIWRLSALADLPGQVLRNVAPHSLKALHKALGAQAVDWSGYEQNPFANLNTVADLVALGRHA